MTAAETPREELLRLACCGDDRTAAGLLDAVEAAARAAGHAAGYADALIAAIGAVQARVQQETDRGRAIGLALALEVLTPLAAVGQAPAPQRLPWPECMCTEAGQCGACWEREQAARTAPAPQPETAPDACARCGHTVPDHGPRGCTVTAEPNRCGCPRDPAGATAYWPLVDPGAARWEQHGIAWTRDEYGNAHSLGPATALAPASAQDGGAS